MSEFAPSQEQVADYERRMFAARSRAHQSLSRPAVHVWDDPAACKPRSECTPFTVVMHPTDGSGPRVPYFNNPPRWYGEERNVRAQQKFVTNLEKLRRLEVREAKARAKAAA